jgi:hypothetical protein
MTLRNAFAAAAVVASFAVASTAAAIALFDISGTWVVSVQTPDAQTMSSTLILEQKGDSVNGTLSSEIGQANVRGIVQGDTVRFSFGLDMGGQALEVNAAALLTDKDNMQGQMDVTGMGPLPFSARRSPAASAGAGL